VLVDVLGAKRLGVLREIVPAATLIAVLLNPTWPTFDTQLNDVQEAARTVGQQIHLLRANTERETTGLATRNGIASSIRNSREMMAEARAAA
jgi:hypothetical protein